MSVKLGEDAALAASLFRQFRRFVAGVDRASFVAVAAAMAGMAGLVAMQVFFRYALSNSIDWAEEVARLFFVWAMFLAIPHGVRSGVHVGIDVLVAQFPVVVQTLLFRIMAVLGAVLMAVIFWFSVQVTAGKWQELMPTIDVTAAVYYIAVLIAAGHTLLHLGVLAWGGPRAWEEVDG